MRKTFFMILAVLFGQMVMADNNILNNTVGYTAIDH